MTTFSVVAAVDHTPTPAEKGLAACEWPTSTHGYFGWMILGRPESATGERPQHRPADQQTGSESVVVIIMRRNVAASGCNEEGGRPKMSPSKWNGQAAGRRVCRRGWRGETRLQPAVKR